MSLSRRDLLALLFVLAAAVASITVWAIGRVDIGLTLRTQDDHVVVADVTPDGNAARQWFSPGWPILDIITTDGTDVQRGDPIGTVIHGSVIQDQWPLEWESFGGELHVIGPDFRPPIEAVEPWRIAVLRTGFIDPESGTIDLGNELDRRALEADLRDAVWAMVVGLALGVAVWRLLVHGIAGQPGREHAVLLGAAAAVPLVLVPVFQGGTVIGIYAAYLAPAGLALLIGLSLARRHAERSLVQTAIASAIVAAGLAAGQVVRYMTSPALSSSDRGLILLLIAAIAVAPALISAPVASGLRDRASAVSLGLVPAAAWMVLLPSHPEPMLAVVPVAALLGWQLLPLERVWNQLRDSVRGVRTPHGTGEEGWIPVPSPWRDRLTLGLIGIVAVFGIGQADSWAAIAGLALATVVGVQVGRGFLGQAWTDAAVPLAAAVGLPLMLHAFVAWEYGGAMGWASAAIALAGLSVAHLLVSRHPDPEWRSRLFIAAAVLAGFSIVMGASNLALALVAAAAVPLVTGVPVYLAVEAAGAGALTSRLETLAVTLTPAVAATSLIPSLNVILLGAWLVAILVWRRFTLAPLLGLARRTQLQRDLAVAAAETERARLAADLHDDALQQLTMLVRTLDEAGHDKEAGEAREIATKLRSIVGDLRLPILDDLGAGAALEWLVERVEPLAGGPVKLERSDATRPPANVELAVFRVAQEALTNAIKHGRPPIAVHYDVRPDGRVTLAIDDAGPGIGSGAVDAAAGEGHFGLPNMQQRAEQIGALLDVRRWPAGGTRVALEWRPA